MNRAFGADRGNLSHLKGEHFLLTAVILAQALLETATPIAIYERAVSAMHAIASPAYIGFDTEVTSTIRNTVVLQHIVHIERTIDHDDIARDVDATIDDRATPFDIVPNLFLGGQHRVVNEAAPSALQPGLDEPPDSSLKTIAVVSAHRVHYSVTLVGTQDVPGCAAAIHLRLEPFEEPLVYNLRELWIDPTTSRICRAVAVWRAHVGAVKTLASITLDLDADGYIDHFATVVTAHVLVGTSSIRQEGSYSNRRPVDASEWALAGAESKTVPIDSAMGR